MIYALVFAAALLALAYGAAFATQPAGGLVRSWVKTLSVGLLVPAGLLAGAPGAVLLGLALGALGDYFLSRPGDRAFMAGMAAFAAGHIAYAAFFLDPAGADAALWPAIAMGALAISTEVWLAPHTGALRWPVRGYVLVIAAMAVAAATSASAHPAALAGVVLFVLSDLFLALERFVLAGRPGARALGYLVWAAYWSGQALILWGSAQN